VAKFVSICVLRGRGRRSVAGVAGASAGVAGVAGVAGASTDAVTARQIVVHGMVARRAEPGLQQRRGGADETVDASAKGADRRVCVCDTVELRDVEVASVFPSSAERKFLGFARRRRAARPHEARRAGEVDADGRQVAAHARRTHAVGRTTKLRHVDDPAALRRADEQAHAALVEV
jgi:hypothetical protein